MPKDGLDPHPIDSKLNHPSGNRHMGHTKNTKHIQTQGFICILIVFDIVPYLEGNKLQKQVAFCACSGV